MKKTNNILLSKSVKLIADELTTLGGDLQSSALIEASQRIIDLHKQVEFAVRQFTTLSDPRLKNQHFVARESISRIRGMHE